MSVVWGVVVGAGHLPDADCGCSVCLKTRFLGKHGVLFVADIVGGIAF